MPRLAAGASMLIIVAAIACFSSSDDPSVAVAPGLPLLAKSTVTDPTATYRFPITDTLNVQSDGAFSDGTFSVYDNGVCGVEATIFATAAASNSGDATLGTYAPRTKDRSCAQFPRHFVVTFPDGLTESTTSFSNLQRIENTTYSIPVGTTVKRAFHMGLATSLRCDGLVWAGTEFTTPIPGDSVFVTRTAADSWHIQSQPYPNNRAWCKPNGPTYNMAVEFTITSSRALP